MNAGAPPRSTFLLISQVYVPDPASVGQHMAGAAAELAKRGHRVIVLTSERGYDNPTLRYPKREIRDGVEIRRLPFASFGKESIAVRVAGWLLFLLQAIVHGLFLKNVSTVVVTTAPPMSAIAAVALSSLKRLRVEYWIMDLNPDQAIAIGAARAGSLTVRGFDWLNRQILSRASNVVVMDRFMKLRVVAKLPAVENRLTILPPWPLEDVEAPLPHNINSFRSEHGLQQQFVVMYSGNHSPANPLATLVAAAEAMQGVPGLTFLFVGGGVGKRDVEASTSTNIRSLPYQPLSRLRESLSAGDIHVVSIGDGVVGMVHPCKVYGAMAVARPILLFGPPENHVADLLASEGIGWHVAHGDVAGAVATLKKIHGLPAEELQAMGLRAQQIVSSRLGRAALTNALCDVFEGRAQQMKAS
ncbi:MAG: glycosyltransferase family 4 protein [Gemmatimonadota bacterium]|nr:glycosyltransferase family 4 protein [Gemmatimonadota bacterium]